MPGESPLFRWRRALVDPSGELTKTQRFVGLVLSLHMDAKGGSCWPSTLTLAYECRVARSTVKAATKALREAGYLESERRGLGKTNSYFAALPGVGRLSDFHGPTDEQKLDKQPDREDVLGRPPYPPHAGGRTNRPPPARQGKRKGICKRCGVEPAFKGDSSGLCLDCLVEIAR